MQPWYPGAGSHMPKPWMWSGDEGTPLQCNENQAEIKETSGEEVTIEWSVFAGAAVQPSANDSVRMGSVE